MQGMRLSQIFQKKEARIYLDYAAATPVRPDVFAAMQPYFSDVYGNAGAIHTEGVRASRAVEEARASVARVLQVREEHVVFTSGGTESNNLAILGYIEHLMHAEKIAPTDIEIITTPVEHPSVSEVIGWIQKHGVVVHDVPVDESGRVVRTAFEALLSEKTRLVTFAYANSETGVVQDVGKFSRIIRAHEKKVGSKIVFHTDGAQAPLWLPCAPEHLGVDMISLDAGKCYGPKGVGVLAYRHGVAFAPVTYGGPQEHKLRPGTENTPLIVGCAAALTIAQEKREERSENVRNVRDQLIERLTSAIDGVVLNGSKEHRLPNNVNISIPGIDSEFAVVTLDTHGVACSTKSACGGKDSSGSKVIRAMTGDEARATSTIRFSLGEDTTKDDIDRVVDILKDHVLKSRAFNKTLT